MDRQWRYQDTKTARYLKGIVVLFLLWIASGCAIVRSEGQTPSPVTMINELAARNQANNYFRLKYSIRFFCILALVSLSVVGLGMINSVAQAQGPDGYHFYYVAPGGNCGGVTPCYSSIQAAVDAVDAP
jgi:hypothetical protein